ncbi:ABC transporter permease [Azospirillum agricola]|uniref:ABC transporter permease n=1 Tax=Azospirillum agricola TaxID=1720247 RepID=UPI000A0F2B08|nr:ABC transporter permease [Azospirillum agricola]SMH61671.1 NitT/TauT family transport system permease protein [Azospirillum lipoferum]
MRTRLYGWAAFPALLLVWSAAAWNLPPYVLPQPWTVAAEAVRWLDSGQLATHVGASLLREAGGFAVAVLGALALGLAGALSPGFRAFSAPLTGLFMAIPPIAWAPLSMIFFGLGYVAITMVIVVAALFPMAVTVQEGFLAIRNGNLRAARVLGARRWQLIRHVYLPASLPFLTAALRIGFSQAWRALVAAEMLGASQGIGWMVAMGGQIGNATQVLLGVAIIGMTAWITESLVFRRIERRYRHWHLA